VARFPNLAPLAGDSQPTEFHFTTDPVTGTVKICDADPNRWAVIVTCQQAGLRLVTASPDPAFPTGVGVPSDGPLELTYAKYLSFCQQQLYYFTDNPIHDIEVVLIRFLNRG